MATSPVSYAVITECASFGSLTGVDVVTGTLSHEAIEAVTDPLPQSSPAYQNPSNANLGWPTSAAGGELADMCEVDPEAFFRSKEISIDAGGVGSVVLQRSWSNAQVATGSDPCLPQYPDIPFFDAMPVVNDVIPVMFSDSDPGVRHRRRRPVERSGDDRARPLQRPTEPGLAGHRSRPPGRRQRHLPDVLVHRRDRQQRRRRRRRHGQQRDEAEDDHHTHRRGDRDPRDLQLWRVFPGSERTRTPPRT